MVTLAGRVPDDVHDDGADDLPDDLVLASLLGHHAHLAQRRGRAVRYRPDVSAFAALPADAGGDDWWDLAVLAAAPSPSPSPSPSTSPSPSPSPSRPPDSTEDARRSAGHGGRAAAVTVLLSELPRHVPDGWVPAGAPVPGVQMVDARVDARASERAVELGAADVGAMLALTGAARPGPFEASTHLMGRYLGIHQGGALVAMAGERMHPRGWVEVSAVCTDPSARGQGLAGELVRAVVAGVRDRGERALLHVEDGSPARGLYERLGFAVRRPVALHRLQVPPALLADAHRHVDAGGDAEHRDGGARG